MSNLFKYFNPLIQSPVPLFGLFGNEIGWIAFTADEDWAEEWVKWVNWVPDRPTIHKMRPKFIFQCLLISWMSRQSFDSEFRPFYSIFVVSVVQSFRCWQQWMINKIDCNEY